MSIFSNVVLLFCPLWSKKKEKRGKITYQKLNNNDNNNIRIKTKSSCKKNYEKLNFPKKTKSLPKNFYPPNAHFWYRNSSNQKSLKTPSMLFFLNGSHSLDVTVTFLWRLFVVDSVYRPCKLQHSTTEASSEAWQCDIRQGKHRKKAIF